MIVLELSNQKSLDNDIINEITFLLDLRLDSNYFY